MITQAPLQRDDLPSLRQLKMLPLRAAVGLAARCVLRAKSQYASGRLDCLSAIERVIRAGMGFARGEQSPVGWREVKRAVIYAADTNSESVAIAAQHLASAIANAQLLEEKPERARFVLQQVHQAIETAFDACFDDEYAELTREEFFRLQRSSKQFRFPKLGPEVDASPNGTLGPVWPIWSTPNLLARVNAEPPTAAR